YDPRQHEDLRHAVERDHERIGGLAERAHGPEQDAAAHADDDGEHVSDGGLKQRVPETGQRRAANPRERARHGAGRWNEERIHPARARHTLPREQERRHAEQLHRADAKAVVPASYSVHRWARCSTAPAMASEPTISTSVTTTSAM